MKNKVEDRCELVAAMGVIGNKWNLLIIWHLRDQKLRFTELQSQNHHQTPAGP